MTRSSLCMVNLQDGLDDLTDYYVIGLYLPRVECTWD